MKNIFLLIIVYFVLLVSIPAYADWDGNSVEIGVEYVNYYAGTGSPAAPYGDLQTPDDAVNGLIDIVNDPDTSWLWRFSYGNSSAWEKDWKASRKGGLAETYCDNVDLVAFCGHGLGNNFVFSTQKDDWYTDSTDLDAGYKDAEWMLTFTCNFLKGTFGDFAYAADGIHLICGYSTNMTVTANAGKRFAHWATYPYSVRVAWYKYGYDTQDGDWQNIARIFGAKDSANDYLWGYGSVSADPDLYTSHPAAYAYWDYKLNW